MQDYFIWNGVVNEAYKGTTLMNDHMSGDFPVLKPGLNAVSWSGDVTRIVIKPNWRHLQLSHIKENVSCILDTY